MISEAAGPPSRGAIGLTDCSVLTPSGMVARADVLIDGGVVAAVGPGGVAAGCPRVIPLDGGLVAPGLIDIHLHGFAGVSPLAAEAPALFGMGEALAREGVTGYLAAFSAAPFDAVARACSLLASSGSAGCGCLGVLLEGTFVNPLACGGQQAGAMVSPDAPDAVRWLDLPGLRGVVVAPELPGGIELIGEAARRRLILSVGHTLATGLLLRRAQASGARMITHFFNNGGAPSWTGREPGLLGAGLLDSAWWLEVVADGVHVHPENLDLLRRCRGASRVCLVSDARSAAGLADGEHLLGDGVVVTKTGSRVVTATGTLAGGGISLGGAVAAALAGGAPPAPLFAMASANPARLLDLYPGRGAVAVGSSADLTIWSDDGRLRLVLARGRIVGP